MSSTLLASSSASPRAMKIGIIGFGPFAHFLAKTMVRQGHTLSATSRSDHSELCKELGISFFRDVHRFLGAGNDVILICTSIISLSKVLESLPLQSLKRPTLFADVLSVKEYPRDLLLKVVPGDSDVLCTHPMFGPESGRDSWKDLAFVYDRVRIRDEATCSSFLRIFESEEKKNSFRVGTGLELRHAVIHAHGQDKKWHTNQLLVIYNIDIRGCRMLEMSCEEHDRIAAKSQFLTHTIGRTLAEMDLKSTSMNTKGFEAVLHLKDSTVKDSFDLFSGLFVYNKYAKQELESLEFSLEKVKQKLMDRL